MKKLTLRMALLASLSALTLSGCANSDLFSNGGGDDGNTPRCGVSGMRGATHCQQDALTPRNSAH